MNFNTCDIKGLYSFIRNVYKDERGYLSEFVNFAKIKKEIGYNFDCNQVLYSWNARQNTIRGLHFQLDETAQDKIITCIKGSILDIAVDIRKNSPTYLKYVEIILTEENCQCIIIPKGFAHGYQTLENDTLVNYTISSADFNPQKSGGFQYNDPKIGIKWHHFDNQTILSEKDKSWDLL